MPIPLLAPLALGTAAVGIGQAVQSVKANDELQKRNKMKLDQLLQRERTGELGLSGTQKTLLDQQLNSPIAAMAAQGRERGEQLMAASGGGSGADLSRLRTEQARTVSDASQNAALQIAAANEQRRQEERNEIEQRAAAQAAMKRDDVNSTFGALSDGLGAVGALAGMPPASQKLANAFGAKLSAEDMKKISKLSDDELGAYLKQLMAQVNASSSSSSTTGGG